MKRSTCASGSGYVPSDSIGFCVAITRNGSGTGMRRVPERDLALLHHLEQRGLHLRGRAVDLVREQEVAEHRPELGVEGRLVGPVDARADEVGRHQVGRELDAVERPAEHVGGRLHRERLGKARHAFDQQVPTGQEADQHAFEHLILPGDHSPDLEQRLLESFLRLRRVLRLDAARHVYSFGRALKRGTGASRHISPSHHRWRRRRTPERTQSRLPSRNAQTRSAVRRRPSPPQTGTTTPNEARGRHAFLPIADDGTMLSEPD